MHRVIIWISIIWRFLLSFKCNRRAILLDASETAKKANELNISLIRLGDGELNIMNGIDVHYQIADPNLSKEMRQIVDYYMTYGEDSGFILCMPNEFLKCSGLRIARKRVWVSSWANFRYTFMRKYDVNITYGDAFLFAKEYEGIYSTIWRGKELVIFLHHDKKYADCFFRKYGISTIYVPVASKNCYKDIDETIYEVEKSIKDSSVSLGQMIVLVSAGPCAKAIVYRLRDAGVQIIDTGHCWDEPLALRE